MKIKSTPSILSLALAASFAGAFTWSADSHACSTDPFMGAVCITAASFCPRGYAEANGTLLSVNENQALFSLLEITYGGDGRNSFALPDLRGRVPVHTGQGPGLSYVAMGQKRGVETVNLSTAQLPQHSHDAAFTPKTGGVPVTIPGTPATPGTPPSLTTVQLQANPATSGNSNVPATGSYLAGSPNGSLGAQMYATSVGTPVSLGGLNVVLDPGKAGTPAIPDKTVSITAVTGGAVEVADAGGSAAVLTLPPELGLRFCIATDGTYPPRPN
jgi:microcystin-dependent protein